MSMLKNLQEPRLRDRQVNKKKSLKKAERKLNIQVLRGKARGYDRLAHLQADSQMSKQRCHIKWARPAKLYGIPLHSRNFVISC